MQIVPFLAFFKDYRSELEGFLEILALFEFQFYAGSSGYAPVFACHSVKLIYSYFKRSVLTCFLWLYST